MANRFSEFELRAWRQREEIDRANRASLEKAMKQPEPDSAIFVAEDESDTLAGFAHLQNQTDYFSGEQTGYISDVAVDKDFEGRRIGHMLHHGIEAREPFTNSCRDGNLLQLPALHELFVLWFQGRL